jgi:galactokinase
MEMHFESHAGRERARQTARGRRLEEALMAAFPDTADAAGLDIEFARAPGRVNLLGDHTDYNDGLVLPAAVELDTWIAARPRRDGLVRIASLQTPEQAEFWIDELVAAGPRGGEGRGRGPAVIDAADATGPAAADDTGPVASPAAAAAARAPRPGWSDHVAGMAWSLREAAFPVRGFDGVVDSTIPPGADLAWASALELASAIALLAGERLVAAPSLAALAQRAERDFLGLDGGIVDPFASAAGRAGRAILLDCRSLESRYVVLPAGVRVVVCDTGEPPETPAPGEAPEPGERSQPPEPGEPPGSRRSHEVTFRERRAECGRAVALLAEEMPTVASLRDLDSATLRRHRHLLPDTVARRAEHVVAENERVVAAVAALGAGDLDELGRLFAASHESLRSLFEVSSPALDAMVDIALTVPGVVAARMTGTGLGGCTVNLVRDEAVPALQRAIADEYPRRTGLTPRVYSVATVDGAGRA